MANELPTIYKPFFHNPFLVVLTGLIAVLSLFSLGLLLQSVIGYQSMPPIEFILLPVVGAIIIGIHIAIHDDHLIYRFYGLKLWKVHNTQSQWVQLKPTDKVETLRVSRNGKSRLTLMVRKRMTLTQEGA